MVFRNPYILFLIALIPLYFYYVKRLSKEPAFRFSSNAIIGNIGSSWRLIISKNLVILRCLAIFLFIVALARPQKAIEETKIYTEGIDIILTIDTSTSMLAEDFIIDGEHHNRLYAVKEVVKDFIKMRNGDRIGLVAFASMAHTIAPLTTDYGWLLQNLERVEIGIIEDGTAIGSALATSLNRLRDSKAKTKIIILLTDGINNTGKISPLTAAEAAKALGVKVYTVGAGSKGPVRYPAKDFFGNTIYQLVDDVNLRVDEETLQKIAEITNGKFFRATDMDSLRKTYEEINRMEKTRFEEIGYMQYKELFNLFLIPALLVLILEIVLTNTIFRTLP